MSAQAALRMEPQPSDEAAVYAPAEFVSLMSYLCTEVLDGRNAHLTDGVQRGLGRPPRDFLI